MAFLTRCDTCGLPGHCLRSNCHRCRAERSEGRFKRAFANNGLNEELKVTILWMACPHPLTKYKPKVREARRHRLEEVLQGLPCADNHLWSARQAMQRDIREGAWRQGRRYRVGGLTVYQGFLTLVIDFLI